MISKKRIVIIIAASILSPLIVIAMVLTLQGAMWGMLFRGDEMPKEKLFKMVIKKEELLLEAIAKDEFSDVEKISGITEVSKSSHTGAIDFMCGGKGAGSQTSYTGFYYLYTTSDDPDALGKIFDPTLLTPDKNGWSWHQEDGDNTLYLEWITPNFLYYYETY